MSRDFSKKNPQNRILKQLSRKKAVSIDEIDLSENKYAINRSLKNMVSSGLIEILPTEQSEFLRLTAFGRQKLASAELSHTNSPINQNWDGKWRMIILDLPENRKSEREALRYLLKKAGFVCAKNSVWVSPFPFEHFFENIKKDLGLTTEFMIIVTDTLDSETQKTFLQTFGK